MGVRVGIRAVGGRVFVTAGYAPIEVGLGVGERVVLGIGVMDGVGDGVLDGVGVGVSDAVEVDVPRLGVADCTSLYVTFDEVSIISSRYQ